MSPNQPQPDDKQTLRARYRARRSALGERERHEAETRIAATLTELLATLAADATVFAYRAQGGEVDVEALFDKPGIRLALPRITSPENMHFHRWRVGEPLVPNRFGIGEPEPDAAEAVPAGDDLMLVPLVAYDRAGTRLGMGGGFYDRYLSGLAELPRLVGVAFSCQAHTGHLVREAWDVPLASIVNELGLVTADAGE